MNTLERLRIILGVENQDDLLLEILRITEERILAYTGFRYIPDDLQWLLVELAAQRFNRIGSEGFAHESVDGNTVVYQDTADGFLGEYKTFLDNYVKENTSKKGWWLL